MSTTTITASPTSGRTPLYKSLFVQVVVALLLGIVLRTALPDFAISLKILSDGFLKLITMIVAPIVFCAHVSILPLRRRSKAAHPVRPRR